MKRARRGVRSPEQCPDCNKDLILKWKGNVANICHAQNKNGCRIKINVARRYFAKEKLANFLSNGGILHVECTCKNCEDAWILPLSRSMSLTRNSYGHYDVGQVLVNHPEKGPAVFGQSDIFLTGADGSVTHAIKISNPVCISIFEEDCEWSEFSFTDILTLYSEGLSSGVWRIKDYRSRVCDKCLKGPANETQNEVVCEPIDCGNVKVCKACHSVFPSWVWDIHGQSCLTCITGVYYEKACEIPPTNVCENLMVCDQEIIPEKLLQKNVEEKFYQEHENQSLREYYEQLVDWPIEIYPMSD